LHAEAKKIAETYKKSWQFAGHGQNCKFAAECENCGPQDCNFLQGLVMPIPFRSFHITVAELRQMKLAMWQPGAGRTARYLSEIPYQSCHPATAVTPISKQLLDAVFLSVLMLD